MAKVSGKSILKAIIDEISSISENNSYLLQDGNKFYLCDDYDELFMNVVVEISDIDKYNTLLNEVLYNEEFNKLQVLQLKEGFKGKNVDYNAIKKISKKPYIKEFENIIYIINNNDDLLNDNDKTVEEFKSILNDKNIYSFDKEDFVNLSEIDIDSESYIRIGLLVKNFGRLLASGNVKISLYQYTDDLYLVCFKVNNNSYLNTYYYGYVISD